VRWTARGDAVGSNPFVSVGFTSSDNAVRHARHADSYRYPDNLGAAAHRTTPPVFRRELSFTDAKNP
jgi:hypothetical protein